jgi:hypothetical protein
MIDPTDPPIREFADRGTIWLLESPSNLRDLVAMAARELAESLAFDKAERVNRTFIPADLHKHEADLLYRVPFRTGQSEVWVYLLVEHQSRPDRLMGLRVLSYMVQMWDLQRQRWEQERLSAAQRRLAPIVPLVFYTGKRRWSGVPGLDAVMGAPAALQRFIPRHETLFVGLDGLPDAAEGVSPLASVLRVLRTADGDTEAMKAALATAMRELEALPPEAQDEWRRAAQFLVLLVRHKRTVDEQDALNQALADAIGGERHEEVNEMTMTGAQALLREGHRLGVDEGRGTGRQEAFHTLLTLQLERRFGPLTDRQRGKITSLSDSEAATMGVQLLDARSLEDLGL